MPCTGCCTSAGTTIQRTPLFERCTAPKTESLRNSGWGQCLGRARHLRAANARPRAAPLEPTDVPLADPGRVVAGSDRGADLFYRQLRPARLVPPAPGRIPGPPGPG